MRSCRLLSTLPSQHAAKPSGTAMMVGLVSANGEPSPSGPGQTGGLSTMQVSDASSPTVTPATAPVVVNRRHVKDSSSAGKFAAADTDSARPTRNATLNPEPAS